MTAATAEKVWRLKDRRVTPSAGAVLTYLAYRAYYADGRAAWPSLDTIASACFISRATVIRSISLLMELGYVAEGNQSFNAIDPETGNPKRVNYRTTVYDVLVENFRAVESESDERKRDANRSPSQGSQNETPGKTAENRRSGRGLKMRPLDAGDEARGLILHAQGSQNETQLTNNQQTNPSKNLPAGGETSDGDGHDDGRTPERDADRAAVPEPTPDPSPATPDDVDRVLDALAACRRKRGLSTDDPIPADRRAVARLLARLGARPDTQDGRDATDRVLAAVSWAMSGAWWPRRIRAGRQLARHWNELADDMRLAAGSGSDAGDRASGGDDRAENDDACMSGHSPDCPHVRRIVNSDEALGIEPRASVRREFSQTIADELDAHRDEGPTSAWYFASLKLRELLQARHDELAAQAAQTQAEHDRKVEANRAELRRISEAHGGRMFVGAADYRP